MSQQEGQWSENGDSLSKLDDSSVVRWMNAANVMGLRDHWASM